MFILSANTTVLFAHVPLSLEFAAVNAYLTCRNFWRINSLSNQICVPSDKQLTGAVFVENVLFYSHNNSDIKNMFTWC